MMYITEEKEFAQKEIHKTLSLCNWCTRKIGISFIDELPNTFFGKLRANMFFIFSFLALVSLVSAEIGHVFSLLLYSKTMVEFIAGLHLVGYGSLSVGKLLTIWSKRLVFRQLVNELVEIWPGATEIQDRRAAAIKHDSLAALRLGQLAYMFWNLFGVGFYSVTPILLHVYRLASGVPSDLGYVWFAIYPFDKTKPVTHECVFVFESYAGTISVLAMLGSDMIFSTMASHISMLLRLLQVKIRNLIVLNSDDQNRINENGEYLDCYEDIVSLIKVHQRLISYSNDLENAFSFMNLINVLVSSVNICFVTFNIVLLEPLMDLSNKFFLGAALTQMGILCWYADDIYRASIGVADAVYESGWYKSNTRCRRALLLLLQRSQKPLCFTALKFRNITLMTYSSILTTSYSYFMLLYTVFAKE